VIIPAGTTYLIGQYHFTDEIGIEIPGIELPDKWYGLWGATLSVEASRNLGKNENKCVIQFKWKFD
jgi:hypothetical protein